MCGILFLCLIITVTGVFSVQKILTLINTPPDTFPVAIDITIEEGLSVREIANFLAEKKVVRSSLYIYAVLTHGGNDTSVQAGVYRFETPKTTREIAEAITTGSDMSPHVTVTFPEGFKATDIYDFLPDSFTEVTYDITQYEGYLFPDTYFISKDMTTEEIVTLLQDTFTQKLDPYQEQIRLSGFTLHEVITLASIIEREAKDTASKKLVSGILQKRLTLDMPLQVDAVFDYLLDKTSAELTEEDLNTNSPYNTYKYRGLPPGPIANPGLDSVEAVLMPTESPYLYYLTADDGTFYYARTFEEHKQNKARYLR